MLITRIPLLGQPVQFKPVTIPGRVAAAVLDTHPRLCVAAVYVPSRDRSLTKTDRKRRFLTSLQEALSALPGHQRDGLLLGGDYNVIARTHQPPLPGFPPFEYDFLDHLRTVGLVDVHDHHHPDAPQPHSWIGRTGDGYRYDYLHLARPLTDRITSRAYLHPTRRNRLTDHAAVTATLHLDQVQRLPVHDVTTGDDLALF